MTDTVVIEVTEPVRLVAVPELEPDHESSPMTDAQRSSELPLDAELPLDISADSRVPAKKTKRGRAKVPSWDEILSVDLRKLPSHLLPFDQMATVPLKYVNFLRSSPSGAPSNGACKELHKRFPRCC